MKIATDILDSIIDSLPNVPYGIRWICKQIYQLSKRKFPEASEMSICSLVGGFFLLRFVNPAIVSPEAYMIIETKPHKDVRRTMTLMAKMLQHVANKPSYSKETFMESVGSFSVKNQQRVLEFLKQLGDVDDFYEGLELSQYRAMSAMKDMSISISLNEIYCTHALLMQHQDSLCPPALTPARTPDDCSTLSSEQSFRLSAQRLCSLLCELGPAPEQKPRQANRSVELKLFSR
jgi:Ras GTPase-activating-like protein IQGAP2/3